MHAFDVITFDCYGTLIDWRGGISEAIQSAAAADGIHVERDQLLDAYHFIEPKVQQAGYRTYREVLIETAARVGHSLGWPIAYERAGFLADSLPSWPPFPDTNAALEKLAAAGYKLAILSNIDDDLIAATRKHFTVDFDFVITAQQLRSYKPGLAHFLAARERIGHARWLHAAQSDYHDIVPANSLGIPNAWINRLGETPLPEGKPTYEYPDMASFAEAMTAA